MNLSSRVNGIRSLTLNWQVALFRKAKKNQTTFPQPCSLNRPKRILPIVSLLKHTNSHGRKYVKCKKWKDKSSLPHSGLGSLAGDGKHTVVSVYYLRNTLEALRTRANVRETFFLSWSLQFKLAQICTGWIGKHYTCGHGFTLHNMLYIHKKKKYSTRKVRKGEMTLVITHAVVDKLTEEWTNR